MGQDWTSFLGFVLMEMRRAFSSFAQNKDLRGWNHVLCCLTFLGGTKVYVQSHLFCWDKIAVFVLFIRQKLYFLSYSHQSQPFWVGQEFSPTFLGETKTSKFLSHSRLSQSHLFEWDKSWSFCPTHIGPNPGPAFWMEQKITVFVPSTSVRSHLFRWDTKL